MGSGPLPLGYAQFSSATQPKLTEEIVVARAHSPTPQGTDA
ncbi:MAG: hypothetical protein U1D30_08935 [Planctomycetota bacterium]